MKARNKGTAGDQPVAQQSTSRQANEPVPASGLAAPQATPDLAEALRSSRPFVRAVRASGCVLRIGGQPALVLMALRSAGNRGLSAPDIQPPCWHLASTVRDLRALLGEQAIVTVRGDRRQRLPARYQLVEQLFVQPEGGK